MEAAKNILQTGFQAGYEKSIGWPFLLSLAFGLCGINNGAAFYLSIILGALTVGGIFLMAFIISQRKDLSLVAAFLFSFFPAHVRWSACVETNVASLFFIVLTIVSCFLYYRTPKRSLLWLALSFLIFTVQIRPENYIYIFLFFVGCFIFDCRTFKKADYMLILACVLLLIPNCIQTFIFYTRESWPRNTGLAAVMHSLVYLYYNFLYFARYIFNASFQPILLSLLIGFGAGCMFLKQKKEWCFLLFWFVLLSFFYFFIFSFQEIGKEGDLGNNTRFFMMFYPITSLLACYGIVFLQDRIRSGLAKKIILFFCAGLLCVFFVPYTLQSSAWFTDSVRALDVTIPTLIKKDIPRDCIIVSHWPSLLRSTTDFRVVDLDDFLKNELRQKEILRPGQCVLFFENCVSFFSGFSLEKEQCKQLKREFLLEPFLTYSNKDVSFTFYKILGLSKHEEKS